jgi:hypothetical protein
LVVISKNEPGGMLAVIVGSENAAWSASTKMNSTVAEETSL